MKIHNYLIISILWLACAGNQLFAQKIMQKDGKYFTELKQEFKVKENGTLTIDEISGNVNIESWSIMKVQVTEKIEMDVFTRQEAEKILEHSQSGYSQSGNKISIQGAPGKRWIKRNFHVKVPEKFNVSVSANSGSFMVAKLQGNVELSTSGGNIKVMQITGTVSARTSGGNLRFSDIEGALSAKTSGGNVSLENLTGPTAIKTSGGNIELDGAQKEVDLKTSGGNLRLTNISGEVAAATSGGSIYAADCSGNLSLKTSGGEITLRNLGGKVSAKTSGGDIEGDNLKSAVSVKTSGGDIELKNVQSSVSAKTSAGNIELAIQPSDISKSREIELATSAGDVKISLPEKMPASIHAEIILGRNPRFERYDIYSDFPLSKNREEQAGQTTLVSRGDINGGGSAISLKTSAGNIRIEKSH